MKKIFIFISIVTSLFLLTACSTQENNPLLHDQLENVKDFPHDIKLPTFLPFVTTEAWAVVEPRGFDPSNPHGYNLEIRYKGEEKLEALILEINDMTKIDVVRAANKKEVNLSNEIPAIYSFNGMVQMLFWNDADLFYEITLPVDENAQEEIYPLEDIIKIADSFINFKVTSN